MTLQWLKFFLLTLVPQLGVADTVERSGGLGELRMKSSNFRWEVEGEKVSIRLNAHIHNSKDTFIEALEIGIIYGPSVASLRQVNPAQGFSLQERQKKMGDVIALRHRVEIHLEPGSSKSMDVYIPVNSLDLKLATKGGTYRSYVLGFTLMEPKVASLESLIRTHLAPDEWSACYAAGLWLEGNELGGFRRRLQSKSDFVPLIKSTFLEKMGDRPSRETVMRWVFGILALGTHGGGDAVATLSHLLELKRLALLDEGFQIIRLARLTSNVWSSALAFSFPEDIVNMRDLVGYAKDRALTNNEVEWIETSKIDNEDVKSISEKLMSDQVSATDSSTRIKVGIGVGLGILAIILWSFRKKHDESW